MRLGVWCKASVQDLSKVTVVGSQQKLEFSSYAVWRRPVGVTLMLSRLFICLASDWVCSCAKGLVSDIRGGIQAQQSMPHPVCHWGSTPLIPAPPWWPLNLPSLHLLTIRLLITRVSFLYKPYLRSSSSILATGLH